MLFEERKAARGLISISDDQIGGRWRKAFEFGDRAGGKVREAVECGHSHAFAEHRSAGDPSVRFAHARQGLLQESSKSAELLEFVLRIGGQHGTSQGHGKLHVGFFFVSGPFRESGKLLAAFGSVSFPEKDKRLLKFGVELVARILRNL